ncbi:MAG: carboxypeptidase-like regulatory domain-containing protein [Proteiniphilum sp.]|nr:carboxypeptidase-like regulatory domain-containing protein [Proteiniphilum sp.]
MNFKEYIQGQRHGKKANQWERKAMDDPFLQDAIDGYDSVEDDHLSVIEKLEKRVSPTRRGISRPLWIWAAAAVIVLLTGIPLLLLPPGTKEEVTVASSEIIQQTKEITPTAAPKDSVLVADNSEQPSIVQSPDVGEEMAESVETVVEITVNEDIQVATVPQVMMAKSDFRESKDNSEQLLATGRLVDETGLPIIGATIQLRNSSLGVVTDMDGKFRLKVPANADSTLLASFIGMKQKEIPVKENVGDIILQSDDLALNEVVVVAFGKQKKESIIGSAAEIDFDAKRDPNKKSDSVTRMGFVESTASVASVSNQPVFGIKEFTDYFRKHYDKKICEEEAIAFVVTFFIDTYGHPGRIHIKENTCPAMETEIKRLLLGSPPWSEVSREVTLKIEL